MVYGKLIGFWILDFGFWIAAKLNLQSEFYFRMENELPLADELEESAYFRGLRDIFRIEGDSMFPSLRHGELVLFDPDAEPNVGDIALARHPFKKSVKIVKRVREITSEGKYFLVGDNSLESSDSRGFGAIQAKDILGVAVCRLVENVTG